MFDWLGDWLYDTTTNFLGSVADHGIIGGTATWAWDTLTPWDTQHEVAVEEAKAEREAQAAADKLKQRNFEGAERIHGIRTDRLDTQKQNALEGLGLDERELRSDYDLAMQDFDDAMGMLDHAKSRALEGIARQQAGATTATAAYGVRGGSPHDHITHVADETTTDVTKEYDRNTGQLERTATRQARQFATMGGSDDLFDYYGVSSQEELEQVLASKGISAPELVERGRTDIAREEIHADYSSQVGILDENLDLAEAGLNYDMTISGLNYDRIDRGVKRAGDQQMASLLTGALNIASMGMGMYGQAASLGLFGLGSGGGGGYQQPAWASGGGRGGGSSRYMQSQAPAYRW